MGLEAAMVGQEVTSSLRGGFIAQPVLVLACVDAEDADVFIDNDDDDSSDVICSLFASLIFSCCNVCILRTYMLITSFTRVASSQEQTSTDRPNPTFHMN